MKKQALKIGLVSIFCLIPVLLDWFQWDIVVRLTARYNGLIAGLFYYLVTGVRLIILLVLSILVFYNFM